MKIPSNAELKEVTIQGLNFKVPAPISTDMFTDEIASVMSADVAANVLNQTMIENFRNNFAKTVTKVVLEAAAAHGSDAKKVSDIDDDVAQAIFDEIDTGPLQEQLDAYIASYEPGVRRTGGGGGESLSPVDREATKLALELVRDYLERELGVGRTARSETYKAWDAKVQEELGISGAEHIAEMASELLENNPAIRETAEANVQARKALASGVELKFGS